jgi:hypothetical protein
MERGKDNAPMEEELDLDSLTKAEVQTRVAIHLPPERRALLFKQEGVPQNKYLSRTWKRRIKDFLRF